MLKKILTWAGIAFVVYYMVTAPEGAANVVSGGVDWLKTAANSLGQFVSHVRL